MAVAVATAAATGAGCGALPVSGRMWTCDVSYVAVRGPAVLQSRARLDIHVDTGPLTPGWSVVRVAVVEPLPGAGADPWAQFRPGAPRMFFAQEGGVLTLAMADDRPLTLDTDTGDLVWSVQGRGGETEYAGGCR